MDKKMKEKLIKLLESGQDIPTHYEEILFPKNTKKEYELVYAGKEKPEVILNNTLSVPFQPVKEFGNTKKDDWRNMLIFGDNLQVLKHLLKMKEQGKLKNSDGSDGVKLIYIDPPFATKKDFVSKSGEKGYSDKVIGSEFINLIRKRLIILKNLLSEKGIIYVHLDSKKGHYIKIVLDEVFGEHSFFNEIIWAYTSPAQAKKTFPNKHDTIFKYALDESHVFNYDSIRVPYDEKTLERRKHAETKKGGINFKGKDFNEYLKGKVPSDWWSDIPSGGQISKNELTGYPTQKPEKLLERIILSSSNINDIVLDCFAGSGTTGAVAEKLGRRWIMVDTGKLSIYTIQKRIMNLTQEIGNKGKTLKPKPFTLYNAGLYKSDDLLKEMQGQEYRDFMLELFGCQNQPHTVNGLSMHGTLHNHSVLVFDKEHYLNHEFIEELHSVIGPHITSQMFIIVPAGMVGFFEDYVVHDAIKYVVLRIPHSIIEHIKKADFTPIRQVQSSADINQTIDSVGFDFIYPPDVTAKYSKTKTKDLLKEPVYRIEIQSFVPVQVGSKRIELKDPRSEGLAMVMVDLDYDGSLFSLDQSFFLDEIKKNDFCIDIKSEIGKKVMIIYVDIFGNERREIITASKFKEVK